MKIFIDDKRKAAIFDFMNISPWTIYLWQLADDLKNLLAVPSIAVGILSAIALGVAFLEDEKTVIKLAVKAILFIAFPLGFMSALIPSSRTIAMMVVIPRLTESKAVQTDLPELYDIAIKTLKDQFTKEKK